MNHPFLVGVFHGQSQRPHQRGGLPRVDGSALLQPGAQAPPVHQLHGEVRKPLVFAEVVDLDHVVVNEPGHREHFALEACHGVFPGVRAGREHFQGDHLALLDVVCAVDHAHAAAADSPLQFIRADEAGHRHVGAGAGLGVDLGLQGHGSEEPQGHRLHLAAGLLVGRRWVGQEALDLLDYAVLGRRCVLLRKPGFTRGTRGEMRRDGFRIRRREPAPIEVEKPFAAGAGCPRNGLG